MGRTEPESLVHGQCTFCTGKKLNEFSSSTDNLEEQFENHEQIEISRYYERLPKPTLIAAQEFLDGKIYFRDPSKESEEDEL